MFAISNLGPGYTFTEHRFVPVRAVKIGQYFNWLGQAAWLESDRDKWSTDRLGPLHIVAT